MTSEQESNTKEQRLKILIVTRNLPPLVGGMEKLNWYMVSELSKYADVSVVGDRDAAQTMPAGVNFFGVTLRPLSKFLITAAWRTLALARRLKPDVILAGSGLTAPLALIAARSFGAKSMAYVHGLDVAVQHPLYRALWHPTLRRLDGVIANSSPTSNLCLQLGITGSRIDIVHPGTTLPLAYQAHEAETLSFKQCHGLTGKKVLISVGRLTTRKGLREFVTHSLPQIVRVYPDTVLLVVGDAPTDSLGAEIQSEESIVRAAKAKGIEKNVKFIGKITDAHKLSTAYYAADVHVFPVRELKGDPEGFGMVAIEAAAHGIPTVAFATGGVVDAVQNVDSGILVTPGDYEELSTEVVRVLERGWSKTKCADFAARFHWEHFGRKVLASLEATAKLTPSDH
jgi:phosphatidyl-myo-inositol dimannoside synthase